MVKGFITIAVFVGGVWFLTGHLSYFWALVVAFVVTFFVRASWKTIWGK